MFIIVLYLTRLFLFIGLYKMEYVNIILYFMLLFAAKEVLNINILS